MRREVVNVVLINRHWGDYIGSTPYVAKIIKRAIVVNEVDHIYLVYPNTREIDTIDTYLREQCLGGRDEIHYLTNVNKMFNTFEELLENPEIPRIISDSSLRKLFITTEQSSMTFSDPNLYFSELSGYRNTQHMHIVTYPATTDITSSIENYVRGFYQLPVANSDYDESEKYTGKNDCLLDGFLQDLT